MYTIPDILKAGRVDYTDFQPFLMAYNDLKHRIEQVVTETTNSNFNEIVCASYGITGNTHLPNRLRTVQADLQDCDANLLSGYYLKPLTLDLEQVELLLNTYYNYRDEQESLWNTAMAGQYDHTIKGYNNYRHSMRYVKVTSIEPFHATYWYFDNWVLRKGAIKRRDHQSYPELFQIYFPEDYI